MARLHLDNPRGAGGQDPGHRGPGLQRDRIRVKHKAWCGEASTLGPTWGLAVGKYLPASLHREELEQGVLDSSDGRRLTWRKSLNGAQLTGLPPGLTGIGLTPLWKSHLRNIGDWQYLNDTCPTGHRALPQGRALPGQEPSRRTCHRGPSRCRWMICW